jgi:hypothetical protein
MFSTGLFALQNALIANFFLKLVAGVCLAFSMHMLPFFSIFPVALASAAQQR